MVSIASIKMLPSVTVPEARSIGEDKFEDGIKTFLLCMKLSGLYHLDLEADSSRKPRRYAARVYRWFVPGILLVNFLFSLGEFSDVKEFDGILLNNLISSIWFLQVLGFSINNAIRCTLLDKVYSVWDSYAEDNKIETKRTVRRISIACTIGYIIWLVSAIAFLAISTTTPRPPSGFMLYIPETLAIFVTIFIIIAYCYFVSTWFLLTAQFTVMGVCICRLLSQFYKTMKRCFESCEFIISDRIESFRQQHEKICLMIELADNVLCVFVMMTVFTTIPLIVLTMYFVIFVNTENGNFSYIATWWSISLSTMQLAVVFVVGGIVNYMVHRPSGLLYQLNLAHAASRNVLQLGVFLNRLTTQPIGFTAVGLFVLDKPTIITFVGSIATYAIVMIQFKPGGDATYSLTCYNTSSSV